jgi:SAM-dependent methyltransferase
MRGYARFVSLLLFALGWLVRVGQAFGTPPLVPIAARKGRRKHDTIRDVAPRLAYPQRNDLTNKRQHWWARRTVLASFLTGWWMGGALPFGSSAVADDDVCQSGALLPEQAITGAYEQECMTRAVRDIPLSQSSRVVLKMQQGAAGAGTTGLAVWNASLLLSRLLQELFQQQQQQKEATTSMTKDVSWSSLRIVELGCGTGLASLTAAALGARQVLATDGNPAVVQLARQNIVANDLTDRVQAAVLPWGLMDALDYVDKPFDLVLGSDLTYQSQNWPALAQSMATLVAPDGGCILYVTLGHAGFAVQAELAGFLAVATQYGLIPVTEAPAWWSGSTTTKELTRLLYQTCVRPSEQELVQSTGGIGVLLLQKKRTLR